MFNFSQHVCTNLILIFIGETGVSWTDKIYSTLIMWVINLAIIFAFLIQIFVYFEPTFKRKTSTADAFWRHTKQGDLYLTKVRIPHDYFFYNKNFYRN